MQAQEKTPDTGRWRSWFFALIIGAALATLLLRLLTLWLPLLPGMILMRGAVRGTKRGTRRARHSPARHEPL